MSQLIEILGLIIGGIVSGGGISYFFFWKAQKKKVNNEADEVGAEAAQKTFAVSKDQSEYLIEKLTQYQKDYYSLEDEHRTRMKSYQDEMAEREKKFQDDMIISSREFSEKINAKCTEIAALKSEITYLKGLRCYKSDCLIRIKENPFKNDNYK